jgi:hypothetical protein
LSVDSKESINTNFDGLFHTTPPIEPDYTGDELHSVYFEGFPDDRIFGYYSKNNRKFSAQIGSHESLWTVVFLMMRDLGQIKPYVWSTEESHKKQLAKERKSWNREHEAWKREQEARKQNEQAIP